MHIYHSQHWFYNSVVDLLDKLSTCFYFSTFNNNRPHYHGALITEEIGLRDIYSMARISKLNDALTRGGPLTTYCGVDLEQYCFRLITCCLMASIKYLNPCGYATTLQNCDLIWSSKSKSKQISLYRWLIVRLQEFRWLTHLSYCSLSRKPSI